VRLIPLLDRDWHIKPKRNFVQAFETSLNAPGWSISLLNVGGISRETGLSISQLFELLDAETDAPSWPRNGYMHSIESTSTSADKGKRATAGAGGVGPKGR